MGVGGWGGGGFGGGLSGWGGAGGGLTIVGAAAIAENAVLVQFSTAVYYSGLLDTQDASIAALWTATPVAGTSGYDGNASRAVSVVTVAPLAVAGGGQDFTSLVLLLDRPMTPYPSEYVVGVSAVWSADLSTELTNAQSAPFFGVYKQLNQPQVEVPSPGRDFANPQTAGGAQSPGSNISRPVQQLLGTLGYSDDNDYAVDKGDAGLRKRLTRRTFCKKSGFAFLPGYGVGITTYGKALGKASTRDQLAAECEAQYVQEPEVASATVAVRPDPTNPNLFRLGIFIAKKSGKTAKYSVLISSLGSSGI